MPFGDMVRASIQRAGVPPFSPQATNGLIAGQASAQAVPVAPPVDAGAARRAAISLGATPRRPRPTSAGRMPTQRQGNSLVRMAQAAGTSRPGGVTGQAAQRMQAAITQLPRG